MKWLLTSYLRQNGTESFLNLQRNYYETMARLEKEEKLKGVPLKQEWVEDIKEAFNKNLKKKIPREF